MSKKDSNKDAIKSIEQGGAEVEKKRRISTPALVLSVFAFVVAVIVLPTSILLAVGLLPTFVAILSGRRGRRAQAISVGAMNIAGCSPFLFQLWSDGHTMEMSLEIVSDPMAVVIMYAGAGTGYVIDWALGGVMGVFLYQKNMARVATIEKKQAELTDRWGEAVTGNIPLDSDGFPVDSLGMV